jgi:hypothetical protein
VIDVGYDKIVEFQSLDPNPHIKGDVVTLLSPLVSPGQTTMYIDTTDSVTTNTDNDEEHCWLEKADFGFE